MRPGLLGSVAVLTALAVGTQAQPASREAPPHDCFFLSQWDGWRAQDERTINIRVRPSATYQIKLAIDCPSVLVTTDGLRITPIGGLGEICSAADIDPIVVRNRALSEQCIVRSIRRLTPDEVAALPPSARPNR